MLRKLVRDITVVKDGKEYVFHTGDVIEPDVYKVPEKYFDEGYQDKMVREKSK
jgi:hypothetical protein